jgi:hypothetical protein
LGNFIRECFLVVRFFYNHCIFSNVALGGFTFSG